MNTLDTQLSYESSALVDVEALASTVQCHPHEQHDMKIVIVDDIAINVKVTRAHLEAAGYSNFSCVTDSTEAFERIDEVQPDLVLLDIMMPSVSGLDILKAIRADCNLSQTPVLVLTGAESKALKTEALDLGATDFLMKPVDVEHLLPRVRNCLLMKRYQDNLKSQVLERTQQLEQAQRELIHCLARAAEYRDYETGAHVIRVGMFAEVIASELGLSEENVSLIGQAATLHDVGKIGIPDSVLHKPGKLTADEFDVMRSHCGLGKRVFDTSANAQDITLNDHAAVGARILEAGESPAIRVARSIALTHHEKWDGSGYPLGLAGEDIPIEGRITAVADVFDALNSKRPYKPALPLNDCFEVLQNERGKHFDPRAVDAFLRRKKEIIAIQIAHADVS